ncbi:MAG TPA: right-handed parallel beta-helix repeat-containing protein [Marmoricola sp.]|nr:right-handed parallel beta-helix repeat-containing protein [Marmoricola sp.]HNJ77717.1 right-handed parallel beta-helix repeat-containing protein [Marmoricola sp.]HNO38944.1 right-handed parallel beta-helix repeat-containing protein [Marmoricola sp.]
MTSSKRRVGTAILAALLPVAVLTGCGSDSNSDSPKAGASQQLVRVPADAPTIQKALDKVSAGGMVLVSPGTYKETALVRKPDVTVRGTDRNSVIVDGEGKRPYGVVGIADGVRIENLTVRRATFYGVLVTGLHDDSGPRANDDTGGYETFDPAKFPPLKRFDINHVTALNNGLYGIYAFNSQHGVIRDNYASGSADSGYYVGQCHDCGILVSGNIGEHNAVGLENANASKPLMITGNRFSSNRVGMTFLSDYQEAFIPQRGNVIAGNLIANNNEPESPAQADGGFGTGIGISGGTENEFLRNLISGNKRGGVVIANTADLASLRNNFAGNRYANNGVDYVNISSTETPSLGNCAEPGISTLPALLSRSFESCTTKTTAPAASASEFAQSVPAPVGMSFLDVPEPGPQPSLSAVDVVPDSLPAVVIMPEVSTIKIPARTLLAR